MKNLSLLVWVLQLGLSIALPPLCFICIAVWLRNSFGWGDWVIWLGALIGLFSAAAGLRDELRAMSKHADRSKKEADKAPGIAFNDHD